MILKRISNKSHEGQGLAEYAIIIALVAIVSAVILGLVGWAVQQNYGVITGALGGKKEVHSASNFLYFDPNAGAQCGYRGASGQTGLLIQFYTDINIGTLTVRTDTGFQTNIQPGTGGAANYYQVTAQIGGMGNHPEMCPHSVVIQSSKEAGDVMAVFPVEPHTWP